MEHELSHVREIEAAAEGRPPGRDRVVVESWLRCLNQHRLDPTARSEAFILPETALREHRQRSEALIAIARSGIESLYGLVAGQNYVLLLADRAGVTVEYLGDEAQKQELRRSGLYMGAEWSEARAGTCALGACIETGEPLVIHQSDHFDATHTGLSCTAAPIYDTLGRLSAVLDISLLSSPRAKASQSLALKLVTAAARRIEMANLMAENRREWVLRLSASPDFLDVDPEAALSLDGTGRVLGLTHGAARILAQAAGQDWRAAGGLIGRPVSDFLNVRVDRLDDLMRQRPAAERFIETRDGHRLFAHAIEPRRAPARTVPAPVSLPPPLRGLAGDDPTMAALLRAAAALAPQRLPILIEGETGTGKLTLARAIHAAGRGGPFTVVRCAEIGEEEALLFGRQTGRRQEEGLIAAAHRGTLVPRQDRGSAAPHAGAPSAPGGRGQLPAGGRPAPGAGRRAHPFDRAAGRGRGAAARPPAPAGRGVAAAAAAAGATGPAVAGRAAARLGRPAALACARGAGGAGLASLARQSARTRAYGADAAGPGAGR